MINRTYKPKVNQPYPHICIGQYENFKTETFKYVHDNQIFKVGVNSQQDQFSTCRGHQSLEKSFSCR